MNYTKLIFIGLVGTMIFISGCQRGATIPTNSDLKVTVTETPKSGETQSSKASSDREKFIKAYADFRSKINSNTDKNNIVSLNEEGSKIVHKALVEALKNSETFSEDAAIASKLTLQFSNDVKLGKIVKEGDRLYRTCIFNLKSPTGFGYYGAVYICTKDAKGINVEKVQNIIANPMFSGEADFASVVISGIPHVVIIDRRMQDSSEMPNFYNISVFKKNNEWEQVKDYKLAMSSPKSKMLDIKELPNGLSLTGDDGKVSKKLVIDGKGITLN